MSYEGYVQCICVNGHYFERDAYNDHDPCDECQAPAAWDNDVSETNCDSHGQIPVSFLRARFLVTPATTKTCDLGFVHEMTPDIYRVPTSKETRPFRCCRLGDGGTPLVLISGWEAAAMRHAQARGEKEPNYEDWIAVKSELKTVEWT